MSIHCFHVSLLNIYTEETCFYLNETLKFCVALTMAEGSGFHVLKKKNCESKWNVTGKKADWREENSPKKRRLSEMIYFAWVKADI